MAISGTFSATGVSATDTAALDGEVIVNMFGTFVGTVVMEVSKDGISWPVRQVFAAASFNSSIGVRAGDLVRFRCAAFTSGSMGYSFQVPARATPTSTDVQMKARRLLALAEVGAQPIAMASPPAVGFATSSAITGPTATAYSNSVFQFLGTTPNTTVLVGMGCIGHVDEGSYRGGTTMDVAFSSDAPQLEILTQETGEKYRLFVNDQAVSLTPVAIGAGAYTNTNITVDLTTSAPRRFRLEMSGLFGPFAGVKIPNNYSLWRTGVDSFRGMIVGDSFTSGAYGDGTEKGNLGYARQVGFKLGVADWFVSGMPGEGYLHTGNQSLKTLRGRSTTDIVAVSPDWVVVCEGINDVGLTPAIIQTEVTTLYTALMAALPNTVFTVMGPFRAPSLNPAQSIADAIKNGVQAVPSYGTRLLYFDTFSEAWQSTGAGKVGATSGVGNSNIYIGTDGVHPVQTGHDYLAQRVVSAVLRHAAAIA